MKKAEGYSLITGYFGMVLILAGGINLLPLITLLFYPEEMEQAKYFIIPGVISMLAGYLVSLILRGRERGNLGKNQEMIVMVGTWVIVIVVTAVPFMLTGNYTFTQAVFETTSGLSTTGLSVVDTAVASHIFLIHRSVLLFFGGVGLVLIVTSVLSDVYGMRIYNAEGHSDRLLPNLLESARLIVGIYSGYIMAGALLYMMFGMSAFDAINHSIAALSTGGFSTRPESIGYYQSSAIEIITIVLMLLGGTNFFVHLLLIKGKLRDVFAHCETRMTLFVLAFFTPITIVLLMNGMYNNLSDAIRVAVFQAVSALTTTGFQTVPTFQTWSSALLLVMMILMLIGGHAGSTAGGIKSYRAYVLLKQIWWKFRRDVCLGRRVLPEKVNRYGKEEYIKEGEKSHIHAFVTFYILLFFTGTFVFCLYGYSLQDSMFEFASALGTVGLSMGITAYDASPVIHWTATIGMLVGRLEIFALLIAASRIWDDIGNYIDTRIKRGRKGL